MEQFLQEKEVKLLNSLLDYGVNEVEFIKGAWSCYIDSNGSISTFCVLPEHALTLNRSFMHNDKDIRRYIKNSTK